jgi:TRAP-type C4-dicarboxylate transport system permease small subunit
MVRSALFARVSNHERYHSSSFETRPVAAPQDEGSERFLGILPMTIADKLVLQRQHHLKWRAFDRLELVLMMLCGLLCFGFSLSVMFDIITRTIGHPWLWLQEVTSTLFIYAIFIGAAVATRRNDHLYLTAISEALHGFPRLVVEIVIRVVVLGVAFCLIWFGYINYLRGFGSFRLPSGTPIASLYAAIPLSGVLIALFTIEQLVNGIRNGFDHPEPPDEDLPIPPIDTSTATRARP